jgi:hypothetical protein
LKSELPPEVVEAEAACNDATTGLSFRGVHPRVWKELFTVWPSTVVLNGHPRYLLWAAIQRRSPINLIEKCQHRIDPCAAYNQYKRWIADQAIETMHRSNYYLCIVSSVWSESHSRMSIKPHSDQTRAESTSTAFDGWIGRSTMAVTSPIAPPAPLIITLHL